MQARFLVCTRRRRVCLLPHFEGTGPLSTAVIGWQLLKHATRAVLQVRMLQLENAALIDGLR